ncbi:MAG: iron-containing redox enzyme family protein [Acidimicrobiia bacterium]|nr:iron-containing redox enzyme family protein [Acidimicrobiia bacterium]MBV9285691.1 iron-containing redox enzyme family protein [Acidimicrobiia bacterium]
MEERREFRDIRSGSAAEDAVALPVDEFMAGLEALQADIATEKNLVWERVADGTLSVDLLKRLAKEYYFLGKWLTSEFGSLVSNAPDLDALTLGASQHFDHWLQNLADETGYAGDRNHVDMKVEWAQMLGITDEELLSYRAMPESIGMVFTSLYYMRRSYEEGLAAFGWAGERWAASTGYAKLMYEGMRDHYGLDVENFKVHAYAEEDHGSMADFLLRQVAVTAGQQRRIRRAIDHVLTLRNARTVALNRWLDDPGALRTSP